MSRVVHAILEPAHVFGVRVAFSTNENPGKHVQTRICICYEFTQSMDEDKDSKQNLDL